MIADKTFDEAINASNNAWKTSPQDSSACALRHDKSRQSRLICILTVTMTDQSTHQVS